MWEDSLLIIGNRFFFTGIKMMASFKQYALYFLIKKIFWPLSDQPQKCLKLNKDGNEYLTTVPDVITVKYWQNTEYKTTKQTV